MARLGRLQPQSPVIIVRTLPGVASGDVTGAATASATVVGQAFGPPARPVIVSDVGVLPRLRSAYQHVIIVRTLPGAATGDVTGSATASATVVGQSINPLAAARPVVVSDSGVLPRLRLAYDPVTIIVPPVEVSTSTSGDVTGAVTASGTVVGARADAGDVTGAAAASATVIGQATNPGAVAQPVIVSDPGTAFRARLAYDPLVLVIPPVQVAATAGDVTGAATASATVVGQSVDPPSTTRPIIVQAGQAAVRVAWYATDPVTIFTGQADAATSVSGDVTGAVTAAGTVVGSSVDPSLTEPPVVVSPGQTAAFRARLVYDPVIIIAAPRAPAAPGAGDVNGVVTAAGTVVGTSTNPGAVTGSATAAGTVVGARSDSGAVVGAVTASATVVGARSGAGNVAGAATAAATVVGTVSSPGAVIAAVTAAATVVGQESGGTFALVGGITAGTAATASVGGGTSTTSSVTVTTSATSSLSGGTSHT